LDPLDRAAKQAVEKHQRLLYNKTLELVLGELIRMDGVHLTREKLKWYYDHLEEFDNA
jgi:hypothetical protein